MVAYKTIAEIIAEAESSGRNPSSMRVIILIGGTVEDAIARSESEPRNRINRIDKQTVASDHRLSENGDLIIAVGDGTGADDPNVKRFMAMGLTYNQAKVMHLRSLGYGQGDIAEMEGATRGAIQKREDLAEKKLGRTILYERHH